LSFGDTGSTTALPLGSNFLSLELRRFGETFIGGRRIGTPEGRRARFLDLGPYVLSGTPGGRDELRQVVDPEVADLVDELQPQEVPVMRTSRREFRIAGADVRNWTMEIRVDDSQGRMAGVCILIKPEAGMSQLSSAASTADLAHLKRMRVVEHPDRRPAAILMADLEASSPLAQRLSTSQYFAFSRRLVRAQDQCIIDAGGIVGRHAGDGVVGFFLAKTAGSESAAARASISVARRLRTTLGDAAASTEIPGSEVALRFGLHWGATPYIGRISTAGRSEVTALGAEVNEAARIEACATGGRTLASKLLLERLIEADAEALGIDVRHLTYTPLAELPSATDKARRDAPSIAVCEI
jgi:class 3 adenylate cyclase